MYTTTTQSQELVLEDLIKVTAPYNRLTDVSIDALDYVTAKVINEYLGDDEGGPMGKSEFGRHIAILGLMELAKDYGFEDKHYFLAIGADIKRCHYDVYESKSFDLRVKTIKKNRKQGVVKGEMYDDRGRKVYEGEITYQVIKEGIFAKLFNKHKIKNPGKHPVSPYLDRRTLSDLKIIGNEAKGNYGVVLPEMCEGHFDDYPALPVAIVGGLFSEIAIKLFQDQTKGRYDKVMGAWANIKAHRLVFTGEELYVKAKVIERVYPNTLMIDCEAYVGDELVAEISSKMVGIETAQYN